MPRAVDPAVDVFDREAVFIERTFEPWTRQFPELRFIHEHLSSKVGCDFVRAKSGQVGGSITPYHLVLNRTDWLGWGNRPYMYCMPVIKTEQDRQALRKAASRRRAVLLPRHGFRAALHSQEARRGRRRRLCITLLSQLRPIRRCSTRRMRSTDSRPLPR